jgi:biopolymer transport protein ExbD
MAGNVSDVDDDDEPKAEINIIPFVDIALVLLIIFILSSKLIQSAQIPVDLPSAANSGAVVDPTVNLVLSGAGELFVDGEPIAAEGLLPALVQRHTANEKTRAVIAADRHLPYERVVALIDAVKSAGITGFALNIDQLPAPHP